MKTKAKGVGSRTPGQKPQISKEAAKRLRAAAKMITEAARRAKRELGIEFAVENDAFVFIDSRREDDWDGYGDIDAWMFDALSGMAMARFELEDFDAWEK